MDRSEKKYKCRNVSEQVSNVLKFRAALAPCLVAFRRRGRREVVCGVIDCRSRFPNTDHQRKMLEKYLERYLNCAREDKAA